MELWVRSQDKKMLEKINGFEIVDGSTIQANGFPYGTYETKERALEVLDEIQRLIEDLQYMSYAIPNKEFTGYRPNVYEMPKE